MASPEFLAFAAKQAAATPPPPPADLHELRARIETAQAALPLAEGTRASEVDAGGVHAILCERDGGDEDPLFLYFHGGGYRICSALAYRSYGSHLARATKTRVLLVDYRLAPEHPFPAAVDDAVTAYRWALGQGNAPGRIVAGGDSAGGGYRICSALAYRAYGSHLARATRTRVLLVDYRLAPEHPFPAAVDDAAAAFAYAREHTVDLGADPEAIAVGGDSAGGGLAAVVAHLAVRAGRPTPAFLLMFYPHCDTANRSVSRDLFANGFGLTDADIEWYTDQYLPPGIDRSDPRVSIALADDLTGMPSTYLVTGGFDPLRDEGELFARRLAEAGVNVVLRREPDLMHGFANMLGISVRCREVVAQGAGALRVGLALAVNSATQFGDRPNLSG